MKQIKIANCGECPYFVNNGREKYCGALSYLDNANRWIEIDESKILDDCPLEDLKSE